MYILYNYESINLKSKKLQGLYPRIFCGLVQIRLKWMKKTENSRNTLLHEETKRDIHRRATMKSGAFSEV